MKDLRFVFRSLTRTPGFALIALLTLALGIGGTTAMFTLVNGVLLKPLSYKQPGQLIAVSEVVKEILHLAPALPVNARHYDLWKARCAALEDAALVSSSTLNLTGRGEPEQLQAVQSTASLFTTLGVQPVLGRAYVTEEEATGKDKVVVLTEGLWRRRFGADRGIVGQSIELDGVPHAVLGVLPAAFQLPRPSIGLIQGLVEKPEIYKPLSIDRSKMRLIGEFNYMALARLRPGVSLDQAIQQLNALQAEIARMGEEKVTLSAAVSPLRDVIVGRSRQPLLLLLGAVGVVLLIVCVNLANLLLVRGAGRSREVAIRMALGAERGRLARLALTESLMLALPGGLLGLGLAWIAVKLVAGSAGAALPRADELAVDWQAALFGVLLSVITAAAFGLLPALRMTAVDPQDALKAGSHTVTDGRSSARLRSTLVAAQAGLSAALLVLAGLLSMSLFKLTRVDKGYSTERVLSSALALPASQYGDHKVRSQFYSRLLQTVSSTPGVESAGLFSHPMLKGETWVNPVWVEGDTRKMLERPMANLRFVSPDYFRTMSIDLRIGRTFLDSDRGRDVVVLSRKMADALWPGQNPIGRKAYSFTSGTPTPMEVVGIAADTRSTSLEREPAMMIYFPYWQTSRSRATLLIRTSREPEEMATVLRRAVHEADSAVPVAEVQTMDFVVSEATARQRLQMVLALGFAAFALLLASLGIYGVVAYWVERRKTELGIRKALGAGRADLAGMVLRQGAVPVVCGIVLGLAGALAGAHIVESVLFGIKATEPWVYATVALLLGICAGLACLLPALRAARIEPSNALHYE